MNYEYSNRNVDTGMEQVESRHLNGGAMHADISCLSMLHKGGTRPHFSEWDVVMGCLYHIVKSCIGKKLRK